MVPKIEGNKISITMFVTPETYYAIEDARGFLKRSTYCGMVFEELFNPNQKMNKNAQCTSN